ncbi:oxidoreductase [Robbsia andropogonis]|uniref:Oxidoreductase n=1 Tax=Robbsia andropogonis TaxID=28092 RepID=A0A0F5K0H3_9BURK|nr:Gfo/Idh/MocA family oxidoreductase [Robbsia andropogonis]KKB63384.1 oxidoreductase [Robbsia andropogonis]MCP1120715.1 Gfo/Idh/MocA family oxidoreductase [Robbsia andropogonis]MCP1130449.1 Gfo/Idh/MocA family oxidoreductase [Robbsia andropogonis]
MSVPVQVGIVGLGRLGRRHAENLAWQVPGAVLAAACSPLQEEREWASANLPVLRLYSDYAALLADDEIDAVWLVTPTSLHPAQIIDALRAGKHVFCEKPLSLDLADCNLVIAEHARHPHLQVMIGFVRRFDPSYRDAFEKLGQGMIGRPFMVRSQTCDKNDPDGFFVRFAPTSGGLFLDCSVHDIDLVRWLLGNPKPTRVFASGTIALHEGLRECGDIDNGVGVCEFEDGKLAVFYASRTMSHGHDAQTEIIGTGGVLAVGHNPRANRVEIADEHGVRNECTPTFFERFEAAFLHEARAFIGALRGGPATGLTLDDAREATRIGIALREALQGGQVVRL